MFQLDDKFLQDLGLGDLSPDQKQSFLQHTYGELEQRVGMRLAEGLSDAQLLQFEDITGRDEAKVRDWLNSNVPGFDQSEDFKKFIDATGADQNDPAVLAEYAATQWLEQNRPDYRKVVAEVLEEIKKEISANRDKILGQAA